MGGNNKNIRSRKEITKQLQLIHQPFTIVDMAVASGYGIRRVGALLPSINGVRKEETGKNNPKCIWYYNPEEV